ncbi:uncharacterized protein LOC143810104 [Ranitomeya variabilis]|uniref:uncharacterized protein LOC143810104 n=1 Tax=Ranitomeya variabilis TaxID=490064 RepID=UPI00405677D0
MNTGAKVRLCYPKRLLIPAPPHPRTSSSQDLLIPGPPHPSASSSQRLLIPAPPHPSTSGHGVRTGPCSGARRTASPHLCRHHASCDPALPPPALRLQRRNLLQFKLRVDERLFCPYLCLDKKLSKYYALCHTEFHHKGPHGKAKLYISDGIYLSLVYKIHQIPHPSCHNFPDHLFTYYLCEYFNDFDYKI